MRRLLLLGVVLALAVAACDPADVEAWQEALADLREALPDGETPELDSVVLTDGPVSLNEDTSGNRTRRHPVHQVAARYCDEGQGEVCELPEGARPDDDGQVLVTFDAPVLVYTQLSYYFADPDTGERVGNVVPLPEQARPTTLPELDDLARLQTYYYVLDIDLHNGLDRGTFTLVLELGDDALREWTGSDLVVEVATRSLTDEQVPEAEPAEIRFPGTPGGPERQPDPEPDPEPTYGSSPVTMVRNFWPPSTYSGQSGDPLESSDTPGAVITGVTNGHWPISLARADSSDAQRGSFSLGPGESTEAFNGMEVEGLWTAQADGDVDRMPETLEFEVDWEAP